MFKLDEQIREPCRVMAGLLYCRKEARYGREIHRVAGS